MAGKGKTGRIKKLADEKDRAQIVRLLEGGATREGACGIVGICSRILRDRMAEEPTFAERIENAERKARGELEKRFYAASKKDWKAAKEYLSRKYFEDWAQRRPDAIDIRKFSMHLPKLTAIVMEISDQSKHAELVEKVNQWVEGLLSDDRMS